MIQLKQLYFNLKSLYWTSDFSHSVCLNPPLSWFLPSGDLRLCLVWLISSCRLSVQRTVRYVLSAFIVYPASFVGYSANKTLNFKKPKISNTTSEHFFLPALWAQPGVLRLLLHGPGSQAARSWRSRSVLPGGQRVGQEYSSLLPEGKVSGCPW